MVLLLGAVVIGAVLCIEFRFDPPAWIVMLLWPTVTLPLVVMLMRPLKVALIVQRYRHRAAEMGL